MGAPSAQPDENIRFLYICLKNANGKDQIDWPAVATTLKLNVPATRMRFRRLEDKIKQRMASNGAETGASQESSPAATPSPNKKPRVNKRKKAAAETVNDGKVKEEEVDEGV